MPSAQSIVEGEVRELVRRRQLDPVLEPEATRRLVDEVLTDYLDRAALDGVNRYRVGADPLMLNLWQQWNAMSTNRKDRTGRGVHGLVG